MIENHLNFDLFKVLLIFLVKGMWYLNIIHACGSCISVELTTNIEFF